MEPKEPYKVNDRRGYLRILLFWRQPTVLSPLTTDPDRRVWCLVLDVRTPVSDQVPRGTEKRLRVERILREGRGARKDRLDPVGSPSLCPGPKFVGPRVRRKRLNERHGKPFQRTETEKENIYPLLFSWVNHPNTTPNLLYYANFWNCESLISYWHPMVETSETSSSRYS